MVRSFHLTRSARLLLALEIGQIPISNSVNWAALRNSGRESGEGLSGQWEFRGLHIRGCSGRCEVIETHYRRIHAASKNLMANQIEKVLQGGTSRLVAPLR